MAEHCANCGKPTTNTETHHVDQQKGNNDPDNLSPRCRNCHHGVAHSNKRAVDNESTRKYGPKTPSLGPPR